MTAILYTGRTFTTHPKQSWASLMYPESPKVCSGNEIAVQQGSRVLSFEELDNYAIRFAEWLIAQGLTQGDRIVVHMPMCLELAVIECAIHKVGMQMVGITPVAAPEEVSRIVESCTARAFIASSTLCSYSTKTRGFGSIMAFASVGASVSGYAEYSELVAKDTSRSASMQHVTLREPTRLTILTIPTVDKTGKPATAINLAHLRSRIALVGPFNHILPGVMQSYLDSGSSLILFDNPEVPEFGRAIAAKDVTHVLLAADTVFRLINSSEDTKLEQLKVVVTDDLSAARVQDNTCHVNGTSDERDCAAAETVLLAHPAVMETCVIKVPDEGNEESLKAVVALRPGARASAAELIAHCRAGLPCSQCPASVSFVAELPKNASGHPARKLLREQYLQAYRLPY
ncbi:AMP-binding protein [Herbaspirillum sp. GCM10030257]|uniref:AMP-binding protein n=1 Tax=Herbaspirillum sp. GCM10030257 TaxID=3273393 RepID=UPI0036214DCA